jgi:hypothetical protein
MYNAVILDIYFLENVLFCGRYRYYYILLKHIIQRHKNIKVIVGYGGEF